MTRPCHCGLQPATVPATVAGVRIDLCPGCVAHYRAQRWPDGTPIEVVTREAEDHWAHDREGAA